LKNQPTLAEEIKALLEDAEKISTKNIPQAIASSEKALFKSQKIKEKNSIHADALNQLSSLQRINKEYSTAKNLADRATLISKTIRYEKGTADASFNSAMILKDQEKFSDALWSFRNASLLYQKIDNQEFYIKSLFHLGGIYQRIHDFKNAFAIYHKALSAAEAYQDKSLISDLYLSLASIHLQTKKITKASQFVEKSIKLKEELNQKEKLAQAYYLAGQIKFKAAKLEKAGYNFMMALALFTEHQLQNGMMQSMQALGAVNLQLGDIQAATNQLEDAIQLAKKNNLKSSVYKCHHLLFQCFKSFDQTKALFHLEEYVKLKEEETSKTIQDIVDSHKVISQMDNLEKDAEIEIEKASIIEKKNTELDSFFYRVSHDLKGPIASLMGLSDLVDKDIKDPDARNFLKMYDHQIHRLNTIVMELINITELNYREIKLTPINFYEIVDQCLSAYTYLPSYSKIRFTIDIESNLFVKSEWYIINTILQNLLENSIKYVDIDKEEQKIDIVIFKHAEHLVLKITDNGQGIPEEHQPKIFDMFYRASEVGSGTGLGLFVLKRAIERLKGNVTVESQHRIGSTFEVRIPISTDDLK
jgi:signal transduction histidine kinase